MKKENLILDKSFAFAVRNKFIQTSVQEKRICLIEATAKKRYSCWCLGSGKRTRSIKSRLYQQIKHRFERGKRSGVLDSPFI